MLAGAQHQYFCADYEIIVKLIAFSSLLVYSLPSAAAQRSSSTTYVCIFDLACNL